MTAPVGTDTLGLDLPGESRNVVAMGKVLRLLRALAAAGPRGVGGAELVALGGYPTESPKAAESQLKRDLNSLTNAGWLIENTAEPGMPAIYVMSPHDLADRAGLTVGEQSALEAVLAARGHEALGDDDGVPEALAPVRHAVELHCLVRVAYRGRVREVHPLRLHTAPGRWLLRGRDDDGVVKWFRVDRMGEVTLGAPGSADADAPDPTDSLDPHEWQLDPPVLAELAVAPEHLGLVRRTLPVESVTEADGGVLAVTSRVTHRAAFLDWLMTMGERVRLTGPPALRDDVLGHLEEVARG